jgi:hypothetical protein
LAGTEGTPLEGVSVSVNIKDSKKTVTNAEGKYEMKQLPEGDIIVTFKKAGLIMFEKALTLKKGTTTTLDVQMNEEVVMNVSVVSVEAA